MNIAEIGLNCTGCMACISRCGLDLIKKTKNDYGFYHAVIKDVDKCVDCGKCIQVCPVYHRPKESLPISAFYGCNQDKEALKYSSSGGLFPSVGKSIIKMNGRVYGAVMDYVEKYLKHTSTALASIKEMCGSKYVQSDIGNCFREIKRELEKGTIVLFSGTKCQVYGLKSVIPDFLQDNLYTLDFICHGVVSPTLYKNYLVNFERFHHTRIKYYNWRSKKRGWNRATTMIMGDNGKEYYIAGGLSLMYSLFSENYSISPACTNCPFSSCSFSDVTIADYWGYKGKVNNTDLISNGISLGMVNTEKGKHLIENADKFNIVGHLEVPRDIKYCLEKRENMNNTIQRNFYKRTKKYGFVIPILYYYQHLIKRIMKK